MLTSSERNWCFGSLDDPFLTFDLITVVIENSDRDRKEDGDQEGYRRERMEEVLLEAAGAPENNVIIISNHILTR